jgi:hypothetical protein
MVNRLSQSDWKRIRQFANTPTYDREPEMLAPDGDADARSTETRPADDVLDDA